MSDSTSEPSGTAEPNHVYLVDGSGYIFRAFHALPPMNRADGTPTNAVYGFTNMLLRLMEDTKAEIIAVIFDAGRRSFRSEIYADYKAHRPPPPPELLPQFALIREATRACNVPAIELEGYEADDLIAAYAKAAAARGDIVTIVSSDKDLMQLVGGNITMLDPIKNRRIGEAEVREKFGVGPDKVVDVQALAGDSTDNVPGVPGIGVKTAAELINTYGDLDSLLDRAGEIKQPKRREALIANAALARTSRELVRLRDDMELPAPLEDFVRRELVADVLLPFLSFNQFRSTLARMEARLAMPASDALKATEAGAPPPVALGESNEPLPAGLKGAHAYRADPGYRRPRRMDRECAADRRRRLRYRHHLARCHAGRADRRLPGAGARRRLLCARWPIRAGTAISWAPRRSCPARFPWPRRWRA